MALAAVAVALDRALDQAVEVALLLEPLGQPGANLLHVGGTRVGEPDARADGEDAEHAAARIGRTARNEAMFGPPGQAYVYRIYGIHWCLNAVTDRPDHPAAVLIRSAEPLEGLAVATRRRANRPMPELMRGPGNLCAALGISGLLNGHDLSEPPLQILTGERLPNDAVRSGPRVGITRAADLPLRFWERGNAYVSRTR